jgi:hypothetical protein
MCVLAERHAFGPVERDPLGQLSDALDCRPRLRSVVQCGFVRRLRFERSQGFLEHFLNGPELASRELRLNDPLVFGVRVMVMTRLLSRYLLGTGIVEITYDKGRYHRSSACAQDTRMHKVGVHPTT